jgi:transcriptional regulator with XRE-family HTH domain
MSEKNRVGKRIRQLREAHELSLEDLAQTSCTSVELLEQIEAGDLVPSLTPLMKIARGIGVRLGTFLDDKTQQGPVVVRAGDSREVVRFSGKSSHREDSVLDFNALASNKQDRHMEPFIIDVHPAGEQGPLSSHEGEEFIYVLSGQIEICYGQEKHLLATGDSIYYDSIVPHDLHAAGEADARILAVVYAPF